MTADQGSNTALSGGSGDTGSLEASLILAGDSARVAREMQEFITKNPNIFGGADIYNLDFQNPQYRAGMLAAVLTGLIDGNRRPAVRKFVIVVPPGSNGDEYELRAWSQMVVTFRLIAGREMEQTEWDWLKARFQMVTAPDRRSGSVLDIIRAQPEQTAIIVTDAACYRDDNIDPYIAPGALTPLQPEDVWVPQLHALAAGAVEAVHERMLYVALDANQCSPRRPALSELLLSVEGCGVMGSHREEDPESMLAERVDQWDDWIRAGRLGRALSDIEQLPTKLDANKPYLRIQMLHRAGHLPQALEAIREEIAPGRKLDASMRVKLARIAQDANASRSANEIIAPAVDELDSREDLESALATAHDTGSVELEDKVAERLAAMFPGSNGLRRRRRRALITAGDYAAVAALAAQEPDGQASAEFYGTLARFLAGSDVPDYRALITSAGGDVPQADAYRMACVRDALARKLVLHAFELAMPIPNAPVQARSGERLLLRVLEAILLLAGKGGTLLVPSERVQAAMVSLIERLAANPGNQALRVGLAGLVQPSVSGTTGLALMASIVLSLAARPIRLERRRSPGKAQAEWLEEREPFLKVALDWLKSEQPVVIGRAILPQPLLTEPADEVVSAITDYLTCAPLDSQEDIAALQLWLAFAVSVTPHCSDPDFDLRLMRLTAGKLASAGHPQLARDLAEQALLNSAATSRRRRLGWFTMADVYHRCHNHLEGLLAIACALAADAAADEEQVWHEITAVARFLRDCGLHDPARSAIGKARQLLGRMERSEAHSHRLDTLELQIRQMDLLTTGSGNEELETLLADVVRNGQAVLKQRDMTEPVAAMLGQLLRQARQAGATIPPEAEDVFRELCKHARGSLASLVGTMSTPAPSAREILALIRTTRTARYSDDVGYDTRNAVIAASRALASDEYISNAADTSFALELLADHGVAVPGWDEAAKPPPAPTRVDEPAEIAGSVSRDGLSVVQAGFDTSGSLVRVSTVGGHLKAPVREPENIMLEERFRRWATEYPYAYGVDETTANLFYTTTADLRLSGLPEGPVVVVADAGLQPFPPNLLYVDDEFAGRTRPMAAAPSLAWLKAARATGMIGDGRLCAWISTAVGGAESQTLPMIAQRLEPTFGQYGFVVDNGPTLPALFAGASMAVITAHGGVHPDGGYFQVVSDEGGLRVTAADLANALRNVGIVFLFVCSGGRADKHPGANTTLGLAKQILDRGCAAVIASPWPLDARVPSHWLPEFLRNWFQGESLIQANFAANQVVDRTFSQDPARGLAMTIFGNPGLRRL